MLFLPLGLYVSMKVSTVIDEEEDEHFILQDKTATRKQQRRPDEDEIVFKEAISFKLPQPSWQATRQHTTVTVTLHERSKVCGLTSVVGCVWLGLNVEDLEAAKHWDKVTRCPGQAISRCHLIR